MQHDSSSKPQDLPEFELVTVEDEDRDSLWPARDSWLDDALDAAAALDWVTPAMSLARGGAVLGVWRHEYIAAQRTLHDAGIPAWAWRVEGDYILVDVPQDDARRACVLLGLQYQAPPTERPRVEGGRVWLVFALLSVAFAAMALFLLAGGAL